MSQCVRVKANATALYPDIRSRTSRLPVIYVLGKKPIDVSHCVQSFLEVVPDLQEKQSVVLKYDVAYAHQAGTVEKTQWDVSEFV